MAPTDEEYKKDIEDIDTSLVEVKDLIHQVIEHKTPWWHKLLGWPLTLFLVTMLFWTGYNYKVVQDNFNDVELLLSRAHDISARIKSLENAERYNLTNHNAMRERIGSLETDIRELLRELRKNNHTHTQ